MRREWFVIAVLVIALVAGCTRTPVDEDEDTTVEPVDPVPNGDGSGVDDGGGPDARGVPPDPLLTRERMDDPESPLADRIIYFEFDSARVNSAGRDLAEVHGQLLERNPDLFLRLEGHADERGSREYNIGLGERRAQSVRDLLLVSGARASQLETVSYGEERPVDPRHNEEAWAKNRRVELVYEGR